MMRITRTWIPPGSMKFWQVINRKKKNRPMETPLTHNISPGKEPPDLAQYEKAGGYAALRKALAHAASGSSGGGEGIEPAGAWRGGVSHCTEMEFRADGR